MESLLNDPVFIRSFKEGNQLAFKKVFDLYKPWLCSWLRHFWRHSNELDRDDIIANAFYHLFKKREEVANIDHMRAFLVNNCKWQVIDIWRKQNVTMQFNDEIKYLTPYGKEDGSEKDEILKKIQEAVLQVKGRQQEILILSIYGEKSCSEIGSIFGISNQTVRNARTRAIDRLRSILNITDEKSNHIIRIV